MEQSRLFKIVYHLLENGKSTAPELAEMPLNLQKDLRFPLAQFTGI